MLGCRLFPAGRAPWDYRHGMYSIQSHTNVCPSTFSISPTHFVWLASGTGYLIQITSSKYVTVKNARHSKLDAKISIELGFSLLFFFTLSSFLLFLCFLFLLVRWFCSYFPVGSYTFSCKSSNVSSTWVLWPSHESDLVCVHLTIERLAEMESNIKQSP